MVATVEPVKLIHRSCCVAKCRVLTLMVLLRASSRLKPAYGGHTITLWDRLQPGSS
jgi:hypothetical protein